VKREDLNNRPPSRREFNELCTTLAVGAIAALSGASPLHAGAGVNSNNAGRTVRFRDGTVVPALGQGSWHLGEGRHPQAIEEEALRTGLELGMTLIDTALVYAGGGSEELIGHVIAGQRDRIFLVSKVPPERATDDGIARACEVSLKRLGTDHLDLYLLHWRTGNADLSAIVMSFEDLRSAGKIRAWGVSNFNVTDMEELFRVPHGDRCATNQVLYSLGKRDIERDILPWCQQRNMPVMAYSPLGGPGASLLRDPTLARIGAGHGCSAAAVALAWTIRSGNVIAIPESGSAAHVRENAVALSLTLTPEDLQTLDKVYPRPQ
jgi:diketogulonate reductase-like aldo/keto reductase